MGVLSAIISAITWLGADLILGTSYSQHITPYWNALTRLGIFSIVVILLSRLRLSHQQLKSTVEERTASLEKSETRFRVIFEKAAVGIAEVGALDGKWLRVNQAFCQLVGYTEAELLERSFQDITLPEDVERDLEYRRRLLVNELQTYSREKQYIHKSGALIWVNLTVSLVRSPAGLPEYFILIARNIAERKAAAEQIQRQLERLNSLRTIDVAINTSFDLNVTLATVLQQVTDRLGVDASAILLLDPHLQVLRYVADRGFSTFGLNQIQLRLDEGYTSQVVIQQEIIHVKDIRSARVYGTVPQMAAEAFVEYYGVPLIAKGEIKGVLEVYHRAPLIVDEDWLDFLEILAGQAAIAVNSAKLFDSLQRSNQDLSLAYDATIEGWSKAMDLRDKETEGHTQRVTTLTVKLAQALNVGQQDLVHLRRGALLHDMGKLGVPDQILLKPATLTDAEWAVMRQHPQLAYDMLSQISYIKPALEIPYCHHEKWDGSGYPRGLKGDQIPLSARIFAVIDVWDALTNKRPYRAAWTREKTFDYIKDQSGRHFDPQIVVAFLTMIEQNKGNASHPAQG